jgi:hypothetical protein
MEPLTTLTEAPMTSQPTYQQQVIDELSAQLEARLRDVDVSTLGSPIDLARQMAATIPRGSEHPWASQIGPFYDTAGVRALFGSSRAAVSDRVRRGTLLGALTAGGPMVYPVFQFDGRDVHPGIRATLAEFRGSGIDAWSVASWFTVTADDLQGVTPAEWIRAGHDVTPARSLARETVARWTAP